MLILLLVILGAIALTLRTQTGRRFLTGQLLDPNLDQFNRSTFFTGDPTGVSQWTRASVAHRILIRLGCVLLAFAYLYGLIAYPALSLTICATLAAALTVYGGYKSWRWILTRQLRNHVINPLFDGLKKTVGWADNIKPGDVVLATKDYHRDGVTVLPPSDFQRLDTPIEHTETIASRTLGGEWEADWNLVGQPTLALHHAPPPPDQVTWDELRLYLTAVEPNQLLIGLGTRSRPEIIDLTKNPHIMLSVPTGGGKSVAVALLACQILHRGGELVVIDLDRATDWIKNGDQLIPGVTYAKTVEEAHQTLILLGEVQEERNTAADNDPDYAPHPMLVVVEEPNRTADALGAHWADMRKTGTSPALAALRGLAYGGRKRRMHLLVTPQKGVAAIFGTTGGGAARENFLPILGGDSSQSTYDMLAEQLNQRPEPTDHTGRMFIIDGNNYRTVQVGHLTDQQARDWATTGTQPVPAMAGEEELPGWLQ